MVERLGRSEEPQNRIEKGGMQEWEYHAAKIAVDEDFKIPTGEKGMLGGDKKKRVPTWVGNLPGGNNLPLGEFLQEMGENGWEIAGVAQALVPTGGTSFVSWHNPSHWLYFKRPKIDSTPQKPT